MKILIADDDHQLARALAITLRASGYEALTADDGRIALQAIISERPDIVLLDLGMPRLDGIGVLESIRAWSQVPVLVLSGRTDSLDKVTALDAGADDYVTKPFQMDELLARLRALGRRQPSVIESAPTISLGSTIVDIANKRITTPSGRPVHLTPTEWRLLETLLANPGRLMTRQMLLTSVWGPTHETDTGYLRLYISQLRRKLEPDPAHPQYLLTESGMGYRYAATPET